MNGNHDWLSAAFVGVVAAGFTFLSVVGFLTLTDVANAQANHSGTLNAIHSDVVQVKALTKQVHGYQEASAEGKTQVDKLLVEAGQVSNKLLADMDAHLLRDLHISCP